MKLGARDIAIIPAATQMFPPTRSQNSPTLSAMKPTGT